MWNLHVSSPGESLEKKLFALWAKNVRTFTRNFSVGLSTLHFACPEKRFDTKYFFDQLNLSNSNFGISRESSPHGCQSCILGIQRNYLKQIIFWEKLFFPQFPYFAKKLFRLLPEKLQQGCKNCVRVVHRDMLRKNLFGNFIRNYFWNLTKKFLDFLQKFSGQLVHITFYACVVTFRDNLLFFFLDQVNLSEIIADCEQNFFRILVKNFRPKRQYYILRVHLHFSWKKHFFWPDKTFVDFFGVWARSFRSFGWSTSASWEAIF